MLPNAILFDLDDTIVSFDGNCDPAWESVCRRFAVETGLFSAEQILDSLNKVKDWYWGDPERHRLGRLNLDEARRDVVRYALTEIGCADVEQAAAIADAYTKLQEEMIQPFPGALDALAQLTARGVKLALLTNGNSRKQRVKIDRFGLEKFFPVCLVEEEIGFGKPDPRVYQTALARLEVEPAETWMVGDNLEWDVAAPQRLGIFGIWNDFDHRGLPPDSPVVPDRIIHHIAELLAGES